MCLLNMLSQKVPVPEVPVFRPPKPPVQPIAQEGILIRAQLAVYQTKLEEKLRDIPNRVIKKVVKKVAKEAFKAGFSCGQCIAECEMIGMPLWAEHCLKEFSLFAKSEGCPCLQVFGTRSPAPVDPVANPLLPVRLA